MNTNIPISSHLIKSCYYYKDSLCARYEVLRSDCIIYLFSYAIPTEEMGNTNADMLVGDN
jgi:hypothetical protein